MVSSRSTRFSLLVTFFLLSSLLAGCQGSTPTVISAVTDSLPSQTPAPTRTLAVLPPTSTPTPKIEVILPTRTRTPTATATLNSPQTMGAKATADASTKCNKNEDSWQIKVAPSWKPGWCQVKSQGGYYYEYKLLYPSSWTAITFGDVYPNIAFNTAQKGIELRIYQLYNYNIRKYEGTLEDAPLKAGFCDENGKCTLVIDPLEKLNSKQTRSVGGREVLIVDSQSAKNNIRRYFFFVPFKYARPASNRLFFIKIYTPEPVTSAKYTELEDQVEDIIVSIQQDL